MMKLVPILWCLMSALACAAGLEFNETRQEFKAPAEATVVTRDFAFTNRSDKTVTIRKYDAACSCIAVKIQGGKLEYRPGESGVVRTEFDMGNFSGEVDKKVAIWLDGDPDDKPSITLTVHVIIPVLVNVEPKTLKWDLNGSTAPQSFHITMNHTQPIKLLSVSSTSDVYDHQLKTIVEGKEYELVVTPRDVTSPGLAIFRMTTDCKIAKFKVAQAFAQVRKPM